MKNKLWIGLTLILALALVAPTIHAQQTQSGGGWGCPGMTGGQGGRGGWYCPWGGDGTGPGTTQGGQGQSRQYAPGQTPGQPLTMDQAKNLIEDYLKSTNNPNLKLGSMSDKGNYYEADIVTKSGSLADKIQVDKNTGWFRSAY